MPVCFLHVGSHKTGTTAIQTFLSKNRDALDRSGLLVPEAGTSSRGSHRTLVCDMLGMPVPRRKQGAFDRLKAEMAERPDRDIVLSAEMMESVFRRGAAESPLVAFFREAGYDVNIVLYVRNMPQWLNSRYTQVVKTFRRNEDFAGFVDQAAGHAEANLGRWVEIVRNNRCGMLARAYTGPVRSGSIVEDFVQTLGIDWASEADRFVLPGRVNETVGPTAIAAARRIMSAVPGGVEALATRQSGACGRILLQETRNQPLREPRFSGLDSAGARRLEAHFRDSNDAFAGAFWQARWDDVFAADVNEAFTINDLAQTGMTPEESERVEALRHKVWEQVEPILSGKGRRGERKRGKGRSKAERLGEAEAKRGRRKKRVS